MSAKTTLPTGPPNHWWTPLRRTVGLWLLAVAMLHIPIIAMAVRTGFDVEQGSLKIFTGWAIAVIVLDGLFLILWATLDGSRPLLAALPFLLFAGTILAAPLVVVLPF